MLRPKIAVYTPGNSFPSISVTASHCTLDCAHCGGRYLEHMIPATTPEALLALCINLWEGGRKGVLISGGCDQGGMVPLASFKKTFAQIKRETGLLLNVHTGLVEEGLAEGLAHAGVDTISFDVVGSETTLREVYGIKKSPEDFAASMSLLSSMGVRVVPHVCIGLDHGQIVGERHALEMLRSQELDSLVFIIFVPTQGTRMAGDVPPTPQEVGSLMAEARASFPDVRVLLGCMRPKTPEYEIVALEAGADGIVIPRKSTREWLIQKRVEILDMDTCCVFPPYAKD